MKYTEKKLVEKFEKSSDLRFPNGTKAMSLTRFMKVLKDLKIQYS